MSIADKLTRIAENEQRVYNAGYEKGKAEGGDSSHIAALAKSIIDRTVTEVTPSDIDALGLTYVGWNAFSRCVQLKRFISTAEQNIKVSTVFCASRSTAI